MNKEEVTKFISLFDEIKHQESSKDKKEESFITREGRSFTLIWSGTNGNNVPNSIYKDQTLGIIINPHLVDVSFADFVASGSRGILRKEY